MDDLGFQGTSILWNKYSWGAYCVQSIVQDIRLDSFRPEVYTLMRGLERTLSTRVDTVTVVGKHGRLRERPQGGDSAQFKKVMRETSFEEQADFQQVKRGKKGRLERRLEKP